MAQLVTLLPSELNQGKVPDLPNQGEGFAYNWASDDRDYLITQQGTLSLMWNDLISLISAIYHASGGFSITNPATSVTVQLPYPQPDTNYQMLLTPTGGGGSLVGVTITKGLTSFTVGFTSGPASGSWNYDWVLLRSPTTALAGEG